MGVTPASNPLPGGKYWPFSACSSSPSLYWKPDQAWTTVQPLYFSPLLFFETIENPFKSETRSYPIDFVYPREDKYIVNILLPKGYVIESLPEKAKIVFNGDDGVYTYIVRQNGKMIQFTMDLKLNKTLILPSEYEVFKQFYQMMIDKQAEKVVLSKAI